MFLSQADLTVYARFLLPYWYLLGLSELKIYKSLSLSPSFNQNA